MKEENIKSIQSIALGYKSKAKWLEKKAYFFLIIIIPFFIYGLGFFSGGDKIVSITATTHSDSLDIAKSILANAISTFKSEIVKKSAQTVIDSIPGRVISTISGSVEVGSIQLHINERTYVIIVNIVYIIYVFIIIFLIVLLFKLYRYNIRLVHFYHARADSIILTLNDPAFKFENIVSLLTPDTYDFSKAKYTEKIFELAKIALQNASKCCCKEEEGKENTAPTPVG